MLDLPTEEDVIASLQHVEDPELGVIIVDLGLIYSIEIADRSLHITLTMTAPGCPLTDSCRRGGLVSLWSSTMISWRAKEQLGWVR